MNKTSSALKFALNYDDMQRLEANCCGEPLTSIAFFFFYYGSQWCQTTVWFQQPEGELMITEFSFLGGVSL